MDNILRPHNQAFWYLKNSPPKVLRKNIKVDVAVVGGGMSGLSAAQAFSQKGYSVALLEKNYCGANASGKNSGFITPDSELDLSYFASQFGTQGAKQLWEFVVGGIDAIQNNINTFNIKCNYQVEDTLVVANSNSAFSKIQSEDKVRKKLAYDSFLYDKNNLGTILGSEQYYGGVRYPGTFGINGYLYCHAMRNALESAGVQIYEETPVINLHSHGVDTLHAKVQADYIIVCADRFTTELQKKLSKDIYQVQTFLMLSEPLTNEEIKKIFPEKNLMVWDTDLIYTYFRITDNRLLVGGSDVFSIFWGSEQYRSNRIYKKLSNYISKKFPQVKINYEYFWPGLISVSKDIMPLAGVFPDQPNIYYISCVAGVPWACALGNYSAQKLIDGDNKMDKYFDLERKYPIGDFAQMLLGKRITFALSDLITLYKKSKS